MQTRAGEAEAEDAAREIAAKVLLDIAWYGPLGGFPPLEPALKVLGDDFVERRLLGPEPALMGGWSESHQWVERIAPVGGANRTSGWSESHQWVE